jgi:hypothetical protein
MQAHVSAISTDVINLSPEQAGSTAPWYVPYTRCCVISVTTRLLDEQYTVSECISTARRSGVGYCKECVTQ